jgi:hypothetical protein
MPPLLPVVEAGPSKRIANFTSDDEDLEGDIGLSTSTRKKVKCSKLNGHLNGQVVKRQKIGGSGTPNDHGNGNGNGNGNGVEKGNGGEKRRKMKVRAEELLIIRQDLPFYQGTFRI